jgi:hypothetical protein
MKWRYIQSTANIPVYVDMGDISQVPTEAASTISQILGGGARPVGELQWETGERRWLTPKTGH